MRIGLVNLMTKTADVSSNMSSVMSAPRPPESDKEINIVELSRRMVEKGHDLKIFVSDVYRPLSEQSRGLVEYLPTRAKIVFPPSIAPFTPALYRAIGREKLDVVQSGEIFQPGSLIAWRASRRYGLDFFIWQELDVLMHGTMGRLQRDFYRTLGRSMVKGCTAIVPRSMSAKQHLISNGIPENKISDVVHTGIDTQIFHPLNKGSCREVSDWTMRRTLSYLQGDCMRIKEWISSSMRSITSIKKILPLIY